MYLGLTTLVEEIESIHLTTLLRLPISKFGKFFGPLSYIGGAIHIRTMCPVNMKIKPTDAETLDQVT